MTVAISYGIIKNFYIIGKMLQTNLAEAFFIYDNKKFTKRAFYRCIIKNEENIGIKPMIKADISWNTLVKSRRSGRWEQE